MPARAKTVKSIFEAPSPATYFLFGSIHEGRPRKFVTAGTNGRSRASALLDDQVYARIYDGRSAARIAAERDCRGPDAADLGSAARASQSVFAPCFRGLVQIEPNRGATVARPRRGARETFAAPGGRSNSDRAHGGGQFRSEAEDHPGKAYREGTDAEAKRDPAR